MKQKKSVKDDFAVTCGSVASGIISIALFVLLFIFPLILHNSYFDILETKYQCYYLSVIVMLAVLVVAGLVMLLIDKKEYGGIHAESLFTGLHPSNWKTTFSMQDGAVLLFLVIAVISTLQSDYLYEAFWGNEGRYTGLFLLILYVVSYFVISRFWKGGEALFQVFLVSGVILSVFGITDYFQMDLMDFRHNIKPEQTRIFMSTLGNINTYTAYVGMLMGFSTAMFAVEERKGHTLWYAFCMIVSFFAIIMGCSDNSYLGLAALFGFLPYIALGSMKELRRYFIVSASFASVILCIAWLNQVYADKVIGFDGLFNYLAGWGGLKAAAVLLWIVVAGLFVYEKKAGDKDIVKENSRKLRLFWTAVVAVVVLAVMYVFYDANIAGHAEKYQAAEKYLVFDDDWGTRRGYIWKRALDMYSKFPLMHKIFGYGPDTFGLMTYNSIVGEMLNKYNEYFDSAHNEYLQYFVTIGPIGLVAYLCFLGGYIKKMVHSLAENSLAAGTLFAVLCYVAQAVVNINLPIATPVMWLMVSMGSAKHWKNRK